MMFMQEIPRAIRRERYAGVVLIPLLISLAMISACGNDSAASAPGLNGPWKLGIHYSTIDPPAITPSTDGSVEVTEVFSYTCGFCYTFEAYLVLWQTSQPKSVKVTRVPVVRSEYERPLAQLYYALQALNRTDLHMAVYDGIHRGRASLVGENEGETLAKLTAFAALHGISADTFRTAYYSPDVLANVERADALGRRAKIERTPTIIINGKYATDVVRAGGDAYVITILYDFVAREQRQ